MRRPPLPQLLIGLLALAAAVALTGRFAADAIVKAKRSNDTISVTGSARTPIEADLAQWTLSVIAQAETPGAASKTLAVATAKARTFLATSGLPASAVTAPPFSTESVEERGSDGSSSGKVVGYKLTQRFTVASKDIAKVEQLAASLESTGEATSLFGNTLRGAAGALNADNSVGTAKIIVEKLILATRQMENRSQGLEQRLQESTSEVRALREDIESIRRQVLTDPLTGIANRKCFDEKLREAIAEAAKDGAALTLLMGDIDHFKNFNDTWGHQTGDQVLRLVARCLTENTKGRDTAARYGGEEFAVILPATTGGDALKVADQIRRSVQTKKVIKRSTGATLGTITMSIGAAQYRPGEDVSLLIERADTALYAAKRAGRNCVRGESDPDVAPLLSSSQPPATDALPRMN